jgi:uncharacterized protein (DUF2062 family)
MFAWLKHFLLRCFTYETSPQKLAVACALAVYIAFNPFIGFHTLMSIGLGLILRLNVPLMLAVSCAINNPLTMVPVYMSGYFFGYWCLHSWWGVAVSFANPWWMEPVNNFLHSRLGIGDISLWAFMLGGNVLGVFLGVLCYIIMLPVFVRLSMQQKVS